MEEPLEFRRHQLGRYNQAIEALTDFAGERAKQFFRSFESGPDPYEVPYTLKNVSPARSGMAFWSGCWHAQSRTP